MKTNPNVNGIASIPPKNATMSFLMALSVSYLSYIYKSTIRLPVILPIKQETSYHQKFCQFIQIFETIKVFSTININSLIFYNTSLHI